MARLVPATLRARFDLISWDPRGVGASTAVRCFATLEDEQKFFAGLPDGFPVSQAEQRAWDRDPRCKMITLDPDTAQAMPEVLRRVAHGHDGKAGLYGAVLAEGTIRSGDEIRSLD